MSPLATITLGSTGLTPGTKFTSEARGAGVVGETVRKPPAVLLASVTFSTAAEAPEGMPVMGTFKFPLGPMGELLRVSMTRATVTGLNREPAPEAPVLSVK